MEFVVGLFATRAFLITPIQVVGWLGWLALAAMLVLGIRFWWENPVEILRRRWWLMLLLVVASPVFATVFGIRLPGIGLPLPGVPIDSGSPALMFIAAVPWVLAAGLLGPLPAA